jgi:cysteine desulfurase/selenocysteine lyase
MKPDWKALRAEFPALANWTYLNTATYGQMPRSAADAMSRHLARRNELACDDYLAWFDDMDAIRESCARLVHCEAADIAFVMNASAGLAALLLGLPWQSGDEVLTLDDEFPNQLYVSAVLARFGAELQTVAWSEFYQSVNERTRLVVLSTVNYATGCASTRISGCCRLMAPGSCMSIRNCGSGCRRLWWAGGAIGIGDPSTP